MAGEWIAPEIHARFVNPLGTAGTYTLWYGWEGERRRHTRKRSITARLLGEWEYFTPDAEHRYSLFYDIEHKELVVYRRRFFRDKERIVQKDYTIIRFRENILRIATFTIIPLSIRADMVRLVLHPSSWNEGYILSKEELEKLYNKCLQRMEEEATEMLHNGQAYVVENLGVSEDIENMAKHKRVPFRIGIW